MSLQICQFAFYSLAAVSATLSLTLTAMGVVYLASVAELGLGVTVLGLTASVVYLSAGQALLARKDESSFARVLLLAIIFPTGLILSNTRATLDAFSNADMVFVRTPKSGAAQTGGWRGHLELLVGLVVPTIAFIEQAWSAPFFAFAAAGLLSIGAMGWTGTGRVSGRDAVVASNRRN